MTEKQNGRQPRFVLHAFAQATQCKHKIRLAVSTMGDRDNCHRFELFLYNDLFIKLLIIINLSIVILKMNYLPKLTLSRTNSSTTDDFLMTLIIASQTSDPLSVINKKINKVRIKS